MTSFPEDFEAVKGKIVQGKGENEQTFTATVTEVEENRVTLDFNHPLAGQALNFEIELVDIGTNKED